MENNPLRQYFRRPAVYVKLPSGPAAYSEDIVQPTETGELPVYPMTAIDEISVRTPDALFNGTAVVELIKSCIPNIKNPWLINSSDIDAILLSIKAASGQDSLDIDTKCPACDSESTFGINLVNIIATLKPGNYNEEYQMGDLSIKFRPLTYKEMSDAALQQFDLQRKFIEIENTEDPKEQERLGKDALEKVTLMTMEILTNAIEYIKTPTLVVSEKEFIIDFLKNCDSSVYTGIRDYNGKLRSDSELKPLDMQCPECGHDYQQKFTLDPSDFFG